MKVVHCVGRYFPESVGGSEIYVQRLTRDLTARGVEAVVLAPYDAPTDHVDIKRYEHEGTRVVRYPVPVGRTKDQHLGRAAHAAFYSFERTLAEERAQIFHLHSFTYGANAHHVGAALRQGMRAFLTVNDPSLLCLRGTLMRMGREVCNGRVDPAQCVPCYAEHRGVPERAAMLLGEGLQRMPRRVPSMPGRLGTLLETPAIVEARRRDIASLMSDVERVVAVCEWMRVALIANGADPRRVVMHRPGVDVSPALAERAQRERRPGEPLSIAYFGRADAVKGVEVLISAVRALPAGVNVRLRLYLIASTPDERAASERIRQLSQSDPRIALRSAVAPSEVPRVMGEHDVIAVPSLGLETGPLIAMEALAHGIPVLGSRLGGLTELVEDGVTGWLEPAGDVLRFSARVGELAANAPLVERATERARASRMPSSADVAEAMLALYRDNSTAR